MYLLREKQKRPLSGQSNIAHLQLTAKSRSFADEDMWPTHQAFVASDDKFYADSRFNLTCHNHEW